LVQHLIWTADRAGWKVGGNRKFRASDLFYLFLRQLMSAFPDKYPVMIVRHRFLLSEMSCSQLAIQSLVSIAVLGGDNDAEQRVDASSGLVNFILRKLASTPAGEHPVVIIRHAVSFSAFSKPGEINLSK
jgi:hypothetical protein